MPRILIVDDEPVIRTLLSSAFAAAGYEVRTADGSTQAIEECRTETFDVVLSDVVMPSMNGHELARWVAENYPNTATVLMSGYDLGCENCAYSPRCHLIPKPFRAHEVVKSIATLLEHAARRSAESG